MIHSKVRIDDAEMTLYIISNSEAMNPGRRRPIVLICPGGSYAYCSDREAEPIALKFCSFGFNAAVLRYTCNVGRDVTRPIYPLPQQEVSDALAYLRENATSLNSDPNMIVLMGFSAGGHLAASVGCLWERYNRNARPDALVLCYPVITSGEYAHRNSLDNLCGSNPDLQKDMSLENRVGDNNPPTFIWHTKPDELVPVMNSMMFKEALDRHGIPSELRLFETGGHGLSLATLEVCDRSLVNDEVSVWPELVRDWLFRQFGDSWF